MKRSLSTVKSFSHAYFHMQCRCAKLTNTKLHLFLCVIWSTGVLQYTQKGLHIIHLPQGTNSWHHCWQQSALTFQEMSNIFKLSNEESLWTQSHICYKPVCSSLLSPQIFKITFSNRNLPVQLCLFTSSPLPNHIIKNFNKVCACVCKFNTNCLGQFSWHC